MRELDETNDKRFWQEGASVPSAARHPSGKARASISTIRTARASAPAVSRRSCSERCESPGLDPDPSLRRNISVQVRRQAVLS